MKIVNIKNDVVVVIINISLSNDKREDKKNYKE